MIDNVRVHNCGFGIVASSGGRMVISQLGRLEQHQPRLGVEGPLGAAEMLINNCRSVNNGIGVRQDAGGTVRIANSDRRLQHGERHGRHGELVHGNNRFVGNAGSSAVTAIGVVTNPTGQQ